MSQFNSTKRPKERGRAPAFAVGRHAVITHDRAPGHGVGTVHLTDESGTRTLQALVDGQEVEMLAWRVAWHEGPRMLYRVCCRGNGAIGWVRADFLRAVQTQTSAAAPRSGSASNASRAPARNSRKAPAPGAPTLAPATARAPRLIACPVCGKEAHPDNVWRDPKGRIAGCYLCQGRRR
jgi:hypothetical protein